MEKHKLFSGRFNFEAWLSSPAVNRMSPAGQGMYFRLLAHSFLSPGCRLENDERVIRRLASPDTDTEWNECWPGIREQFTVDSDGFLVNTVMKKEWVYAMDRYTKNVENGRKGGRPPGSKKPKNNPGDNPQETQGFPKQGVSETQTETQPVTSNQYPVTSIEKPVPSEEPESINEILADAYSGDAPKLDTVEKRKELGRLVGKESVEKSRLLYGYAFDKFPSIAIELTDYIRDSLDPAIRRAKDIGVVKNPGGYFISELSKRCGPLPSDFELAKRYAS